MVGFTAAEDVSMLFIIILEELSPRLFLILCPDKTTTAI
jgi:hypothetical protein